MARSENETSNSSSAEEEELSSEGSESESEPDKTSTPPPSSKKSQLTPNSSSDESETESESDTEKTPEKSLVPYPNVKPLASKPMDDDGDDQLKKPRSKNPTIRYSPPVHKPSTGKRPATVVEGGDLKRIKKKTVVAVAAPDAENNGEKKLFQRLWSENDEIELIKGMISYVEEKGKDPVADVNDFHEFVKKSLDVDVNNRQMTTKVRRLKKKFENNVAKVENKGKVRSFSNPHEKVMYELSKSLWGSDGTNNAVMSSRVKKVNVTPKTNKNRKDSKAVGSGNGNGGIEVIPFEVEPKVVHAAPSGNEVDHLGLMGMPVTDEMIMNKGLELVSGAKKVELQQKWKNLKVLELKHFVEKVKLLKEQAEVVLDAIEKSGAN
ncbi:GLABROUS1 enhancer-binding protein-like [Cynara cardunculus var. scolymus]|uniref:GLABROUS1 enhancer-binding protein-like n=1 Tax=Cynara cardunculus var. scolymus TaxID=59895 RepID=UPI000D62AB51|nr:GLABROUS1 enhancer-binding protein-like [Cynara cardunculus var. scolymus]